MSSEIEPNVGAAVPPDNAVGLTEGEAAARLVRDGPNELHLVAGPPIWRRALGNFTHPMALLLWARARGRRRQVGGWRRARSGRMRPPEGQGASVRSRCHLAQLRILRASCGVSAANETGPILGNWPRNGVSRSMGRGKTIVLFFSEAISERVAK
jgi:hypothetical protein